MHLVPNFLNHYQKPILSQWGKRVLKPKYELFFQDGTLLRKSRIEDKIIDFYPLKAMEHGNSKDIGYEIHVCDVTENSNGGYNRKIVRTIKKLMVSKIGMNGCYLIGFELNQQIEVKIFDTDNETVFLKIIDGEKVVMYLEDENQLKNINSLLNIELNHTPKYKSMHDAIKQTAVNYNAYFCNSCENLEYGYGLAGSDGIGGKCIHCTGNVSKHDKLETLIFALDIFRGILKYFDSYGNSSFEEKQQLIHEIDKFKNNQPEKSNIVNDSQIIIIQAIIKSMNTLMGGKNGDPVFSLQHGKFGYAYDDKTSKGTTSFIHSIAVTLTCLLYIEKYETRNEYVLDSKTQSKQIEKTIPQKSFWSKLFE